MYETKRLSEQPGDNAVARVPHLPHTGTGILGLTSALTGFPKLSVMVAAQLLFSLLHC